MKTVSAYEAKTHLPRLPEEVAAGESIPSLSTEFRSRGSCQQPTSQHVLSQKSSMSSNNSVVAGSWTASPFVTWLTKTVATDAVRAGFLVL